MGMLRRPARERTPMANTIDVPGSAQPTARSNTSRACEEIAHRTARHRCLGRQVGKNNEEVRS
jgi:hypothetical protein